MVSYPTYGNLRHQKAKIRGVHAYQLATVEESDALPPLGLIGPVQLQPAEIIIVR